MIMISNYQIIFLGLNVKNLLMSSSVNSLEPTTPQKPVQWSGTRKRPLVMGCTPRIDLEMPNYPISVTYVKFSMGTSDTWGLRFNHSTWWSTSVALISWQGAAV